jgi:hypothetical protein
MLLYPEHLFTILFFSGRERIGRRFVPYGLIHP